MPNSSARPASLVRLTKNLSTDHRHAYQRITAALEHLGRRVLAQLGPGYSLKLTSGFTLKGGVRGAQPKDLWFGVYPTENKGVFVGNPQVLLIVSSRGLAYGFAATTYPRDFSNP